MKKALLLGAGFSYDLGMPLASDLTKIFLNIFNQNNIKKLTKTLENSDPFGNGRFLDRTSIIKILSILLEKKIQLKNGHNINYEDIIKDIEVLSRSYSNGQTQSERDSAHIILSILYTIIHEILCLYQNVSHKTLYKKNLNNFSMLKNILSKNETWVFSLNHDLCFESLCLDLDIPITYGDKSNINFPINNIDISNTIKLSYTNRNNLLDSRDFFTDKFGVNLVKLHGGLTELEYKDNTIICNQKLNKKSSDDLILDFDRVNAMSYIDNGIKVPNSGRNTIITNPDGSLDVICKSMLTGGNKYSVYMDHQTGEEKISLFSTKLDIIDELTIIGYSFCDKHINYKISNAMVKNPKLIINIISPSCRIPEFLEQFNAPKNRRVNGAHCGAAEWINYSITKIWDNVQMQSLKDNKNIRDEIYNNINEYFINKYK